MLILRKCFTCPLHLQIHSLKYKLTAAYDSPMGWSGVNTILQGFRIRCHPNFTGTYVQI